MAVGQVGERAVSTLDSVIIDVPADRAAIVAVVDITRDFGWMAVWPNWFGLSLTEARAIQAGSIKTTDTEAAIGPLSTAVALVFSWPGIYHTDPHEIEHIITVLRNLSEVKELAKVLEQHAAEPDPLGVKEVESAYSAAVKSAVEALGKLETQAGASTLTSAAVQALAERELKREVVLVLDQWVTDFEVKNSYLEGHWHPSLGSLRRGGLTGRGVGYNEGEDGAGKLLNKAELSNTTAITLLTDRRDLLTDAYRP